MWGVGCEVLSLYPGRVSCKMCAARYKIQSKYLEQVYISEMITGLPSLSLSADP